MHLYLNAIKTQQRKFFDRLNRATDLNEAQTPTIGLYPYFYTRGGCGCRRQKLKARRFKNSCVTFVLIVHIFFPISFLNDLYLQKSICLPYARCKGKKKHIFFYSVFKVKFYLFLFHFSMYIFFAF